MLEAFQPAVNAWVNCGGACTPLPEAVEAPAVVAMDGILYAIGGGRPTTGGSVSVYAYVPSLNGWNARRSLLQARCCVAAAAIAASGNLWVIGGRGGAGGSVFLRTVERYDPVRDLWDLANSLDAGRGDVAAGLLGNVILWSGGHTAASAEAAATTQTGAIGLN